VFFDLWGKNTPGRSPARGGKRGRGGLVPQGGEKQPPGRGPGPSPAAGKEGAAGGPREKTLLPGPEKAGKKKKTPLPTSPSPEKKEVLQ